MSWWHEQQVSVKNDKNRMKESTPYWDWWRESDSGVSDPFSDSVHWETEEKGDEKQSQATPQFIF